MPTVAKSHFCVDGELTDFILFELGVGLRVLPLTRRFGGHHTRFEGIGIEFGQLVGWNLMLHFGI